MRKITSLTAALLLGTTPTLIGMAPPAQAQMLLLGVGVKPVSGGGGYTGPGDLQTVPIYLGLRALNAAQASAGVPAFLLCTAADALCTVIHVTSTGGLNAADITTSTCATTCTIKTWYNQGALGASADTDGATVSTSRCVFSPTGSAGGVKPAAICPANATFYQTTGSIVQAQPLTLLATAQAKTATSQNPIIRSGCGAINLNYDGTNQISYSAGGTVAFKGTIDTNWHGVGAAFSNSSSDAYAIDATSGTAGAASGSNGLSGLLTPLGDNACSPYGNVNFEEGMIVYSGLSQADITAINANSKSYWGY